MCDCPLRSLSPLSPVLAELKQADLITSEECKGMSYPSHVVRAQRLKPPKIRNETADVLRRHGFEEESNFLGAGKQTMHMPLCSFPVNLCH